ncbi:hypothetical protein QBC47DRAFT_165241 [Echria macrotheca]|uniref:Uncharacterized protein n=1 Tax=Echria macrotheca TaxID=438768 RepID=A0AAJ0BL04_9PEZI|nr:hypothetical protein QBC47DRAFT_165241 [Echria macrotheca]
MRWAALTAMIPATLIPSPPVPANAMSHSPLTQTRSDPITPTRELKNLARTNQWHIKKELHTRSQQIERKKKKHLTHHPLVCFSQGITAAVRRLRHVDPDSSHVTSHLPAFSHSALRLNPFTCLTHPIT